MELSHQQRTTNFIRFEKDKNIINVADKVMMLPVISNCDYYMKICLRILDLYLQPLAQAVRSYIEGANDFLNKLRFLPKLPGILFYVRQLQLVCTQIFRSRRAYLHLGSDQISKWENTSSDTLCDLSEVLLENNIFKFCNKNINARKRDLQSEQNLHLFIVFSLWQNWKRKFYKKQNLNSILGGGIQMKYFSFGSMEKKT